MSDKTGKTFDLELFKRILAYSKPYKGTFVGVAISAIILAVVSSSRPYLLKEAINGPIVGKDQDGLVFYIALIVLALFLEVILQFLFVFFSNWLGQSIVKDIRTQLFDKIIGFKKKYFDNNSVGKLVTNAVSDVEKIAEVFSQGFFLIIGDLLKVFVVMCVMLFVDWKLSLYVFALLPIILIATRIFQKAMKKAFKDVRKQVSALNSFVQERITGIKIVQLFAQEKNANESFRLINEEHKKAWIKTVWYNSIFFPIIELASSVAIAIIIWNAGLDVVLKNDTSNLGLIAMFVQMVSMLFRPLRQLADKFNTLQMGMVAANRVFSVFDTVSIIEDQGDKDASVYGGGVSFRDVEFSYVAGEKVLKGISFEVKEGETVAIVGATGAGKSTIISLLSRFYEVDSGEILVGGVSVSEFTLTSLRSKIAVVLQDVFLFADTIYNNITLNNESISLAEVQAAAKAIGVDEFINKLPGGYAYNVKERGVVLSSGQRQLLAFLRAYVNAPDILILDEATSSIDSNSEQLIQKATTKITEGRTAIVIAHRLATIKSADKIIVMDKGCIVETGTHEQLLQNANGYYRKLHDMQFVQ